MLSLDLAAAGTTAASLAGTSWGDTALKVVPIAALTTVVFGYVLAALIADRQEKGKRRAADRLRIQVAVMGFRSHLIHHRSRAAVRQKYDTDFLPDTGIDQFVEEVVNAGLSQPRRTQRRLRACLVRLVSDQRVRMAEEIGLENARLREGEDMEQSLARQDARLGWHQRTYLGAGIVETASVIGRLRQSPHLGELHDRAQAEVDSLLQGIGIKQVGLAGRQALPETGGLPSTPAP